MLEWTLRELNQIQHSYLETQESQLNRGPNHSTHEIFSDLQIPPTTPFFARLDGRRFSSKKGQTLIQQILKETMLEKGR